MHSARDEIQPYEKGLSVNECKVFFAILLPNNAKGMIPVVFKGKEGGIPELPCFVYVGAVIPFVVCKLRTWRLCQIGPNNDNEFASYTFLPPLIMNTGTADCCKIIAALVYSYSWQRAPLLADRMSPRCTRNSA
jgi:hypothetical protein